MALREHEPLNGAFIKQLLTFTGALRHIVREFYPGNFFHVGTQEENACRDTCENIGAFILFTFVEAHRVDVFPSLEHFRVEIVKEFAHWPTDHTINIT